MTLDLIELLKVVFLGIVEGITEWLPISSTGHMLLVDAFMPLQMSDSFKEMFFVVIQLGAIIAVVVVFWHKMWPFRKQPGNRLAVRMESLSIWLKVAIACIPLVVIAFPLDDFVESHFGTPLTIALMLILYGVAFILIENWNKQRTPAISTLGQIDWKTALFIGLFQVLSIIPGTSRSGATIVGALLLGVSRTAAAEFTFFLAVPTMLGASLLKLVKFGLGFTGGEMIALLLGSVVAFLVSLFVIRFLMDYVRRHDFRVFGWYRIVLGIIVLILQLV